MTLQKEKFLVVTMPDNSRWAVPVAIIARNRAQYYAPRFGGDVSRSLKEDTRPLFDGDDFEVNDWAGNNMNWSDVQSHAVKLANDEPIDFQDGWVNGEKDVVSLPSAIKK